MTTVGGVIASILARGRFGNIGPKKGNRLYFKGTGANTGGFLSSKGKFIKLLSKQKFLVVPDLKDFPLKAYVAKDTPKV